MNKTRSVKVIKNTERKAPKINARIKAAGRNRYSKAVRAWIVEFQENRRDESLPAFDSLFKHALPQSGQAD